MSDQKTFLPLGAAAQADNDPHRTDYIRHDQHEPTVNTRMSAADRYALAWTSIAAVFAAFTLLWLIKFIARWSVTAFAPSAGCTLATGLFWFMPIAIASAVVVVPIVVVWRHVRLTQAEMARKAITRDRYSNPISAFAVQQQSIQHNAAFFMAAQQAEITMAPYKMLPAGLDAYSVSNSNAASKTDVPALPDNLDIGPLPSEEWFKWLDAQPHPMLAAETGGGKSTLAKAILAQRIDNDEDVFVIDPHSSEWFDLPGVGGGEDWIVVRRAMQAVVSEYRNRLAERECVKQETGRELPKTHFKRLTVLLDEANNAKLYFDTTSPSKKLNPWYAFIQALGSGARKVNISILMLVQSANVEDLGISGAMRENFAVVALDSRCILYQIDQNEKKPSRKKALYEATGGREWPATAVVNGEVYLLDRSDVRDVTPRRDSAKSVWEGWDYTNDTSVRPPEAEDAETANFHKSTDGRTRTDGEIIITDTDKLALLRAMRADGKTRDQARETLAMLDVRFENADWTRAGD